MSMNNENSKNLTSLINQRNFVEIDLINSEEIIKKDINKNIISPQTIMNPKKIKNRLNMVDDKSNNKYLEEKSSERNVLGDYSQNSFKKLNLELNKINNRALINDQNTIIENNEYEKENTIYFNKEKAKNINNKNNILELKLSDEKKDKYEINKNPINNIVYNKSFTHRIKSLKKEEEKIYKCLFCEKISSNELYNSLFTCPHFFCKECGKNFFEEIINISIKLKDKNIKIKCPLVKCKNDISLALLKMILSEKFYNYLYEYISKNRDINKIEKNNEKIQIYNLKTEDIPEKIDNQNKKEEIIYNKDNIINITNRDKFIYYVKKTFILCNNCRQYSLYGNIKGSYDLCLNCLNKYCKFCHKLFENRHFERTNNNHCRVVYRAFKEYTKSQNLRKFIYNLLYMIGGYVFLLTFFLVKIKRLSRITNKIRKAIKAIFFFILFIVFLPFILIILPYFPIISSI